MSVAEAFRQIGFGIAAALLIDAAVIRSGVDEPEKQIMRIEWDSSEGHLQGFRQSPDFKPFVEATQLFYNDIEEITHYQVTAYE